MSHSQRVLMTFQQHQTQACFDALIDLFIATGTAGHSLKWTLISKVKRLLLRRQHEFLLDNFKEGLQASAIVAPSRECLLTKGIEGSTQLVAQGSSEKPKERDLLEEAYALLDKGKVHEGQKLFEYIIHADPTEELACMELLAIYQRNHLHDAFNHTYAQLSERGLAFPELWQRLDIQFKNTENLI